MVILRHLYGLSRSAAGLLPRWERQLLVSAGEQFLGIGKHAELEQSASASGLSVDEYSAILGGGA